MKRTYLAAPVIALGLTIGSIATPAHADNHDVLNFEMIFKMADKNKDQMVTRQEFMEAMGKAYDMKMSKMKAMNDTMRMKGDAMTRAGLKALIEDLYRGA